MLLECWCFGEAFLLINCAVLWGIIQKYSLLYKNIYIISIYACSRVWKFRTTLLRFQRNELKYNRSLIHLQLQTPQLRSRKTASTFSITKIKFLSRFLSILAYRSLSLSAPCALFTIPAPWPPDVPGKTIRCICMCLVRLLKIVSPLLSCLISSSY